MKASVLKSRWLLDGASKKRLDPAFITTQRLWNLKHRKLLWILQPLHKPPHMCLYLSLRDIQKDNFVFLDF